jgi:hypothetical protein
MSSGSNTYWYICASHPDWLPSFRGNNFHTGRGGWKLVNVNLTKGLYMTTGIKHGYVTAYPNGKFKYEQKGQFAVSAITNGWKGGDVSLSLTDGWGVGDALTPALSQTSVSESRLHASRYVTVIVEVSGNVAQYTKRGWYINADASETEVIRETISGNFRDSLEYVIKPFSQ